VRCGAARHHHVGVAVLEDATGLAKAVQAGGAGGDHGQVGPFEAQAHGDVARNHVDDGGRNKEGRKAARSARRQLGMHGLDQRQAPNARATPAANARGFFFTARVTPGQT